MNKQGHQSKILRNSYLLQKAGASRNCVVCPSRVILSAPQPASAERRQRRCSQLCSQRKRIVFGLPGKHTDAATTAHRRGARGRRTRLSMHRFMLQTRSDAEASVMVVDGICLMLAKTLSFKTFRWAGSTDSGPLVSGFITPGELKPVVV